MGVTTSTANAGSTYVPIATQTLSSSAFTVTFNSISQAYTDLVIVVDFILTSQPTYADGYITFNGSSTGYSKTTIFGVPSPYAYRTTNASAYTISGANYTAWGTLKVEIPNYTSTSVAKSFLARNDIGNYGSFTEAGLWNNTSAITSITFTGWDTGGSQDNWDVGSTFTLYGIKAA